MGIVHKNVSLPSGTTICYKSSFYPFFVALPRIPIDSKISKYTSTDSGFDNLHSDNYSSFDFGLAAVIENPFGFIAISSASGGEIQSTSGSLPGKCSRGLYISSFTEDLMIFRPGTSGITSIKNFDDICIVFTYNGPQSFKITLNSASGLDRIFYHSSMQSSGVIAATGSVTRTIGSDTDCPFIRITTGRGPEPSRIEVSYFTESSSAITGKTFFARFNYTEPECDDSSLWYGQDLAVSMIVVNVLLVIALGLTAFSMKSKK